MIAPTTPEPLGLLSSASVHSPAVAIYRNEPRSKKRYRERLLLEEDACNQVMQETSLRALRAKLEKETASLVKKKYGSEGKASYIARRKNEIKAVFDRMSCPKGILKEAVEAYKVRYRLDQECTYSNMWYKMGSGSKAWHDAVAKNFDSLWDVTIATAEEKAAAAGADKDASTTKKDEVETRTMTTTLRKILRPDLAQHYDQVCRILESKQQNMTNAMQDLSILLEKAVIVMGSTDLFAQERGLPAMSGTVDLSRVLPEGFVPRNSSVATTIDATQLQPGLQEYLAGVKDAGLADTDDLVGLHDRNFLNFVFARFMGTKGGREATEEKHPTWTSIVQAIQSTTDSSCSELLPGMSHTAQEHVTLLATAHGNLWEGAVYRKALDYLTRILLRLHLAPVREAKHRERALSYTKRPQVNKKDMSRKTWKWMVRTLCDDLDSALSAGRESAIPPILQRLQKLQQCEPSPRLGGFQRIELELECLGAEGEEHQPSSSLKILDVGLDEAQQLEMVMETMEELEDQEADEAADERAESEQSTGAGAGTGGEAEKESSSARIRSLQAVLKMLLESPHIEQPLDAAWVRKSAHKGSEFTELECQVVADIGNFLRPYVPKRRTKDDGDGTTESLPHILLRAPFVRIANRILRLTGYPQFTRSISPQLSAASLQGLQLGCQGIHEALCSSHEDQFDIIRADGSRIESGAGTTVDKNDVFGAFFDLDKIEDLCGQGGLQFAHSEEAYEARKKLNKGRASRSWRQEFLETGLTKSKVEERCEAAAAFCSTLETEVKEKRKGLAQLERIRTEARLEHKANERQVSLGHGHPPLPPPLPPPLQAGSPDITMSTRTLESQPSRSPPGTSSTYSALKAARVAARDEWLKIAPQEESLRRARQAKYFWSKVKDAAKDGAKAIPKKEEKCQEKSIATWDHFTIEDSAERLDVQDLLNNSRGKRRMVVFGATDYGLRTMSETSAVSLQEMQQHLNRYHALN
ncbi:hypothetical protein BGZ72_004325, partial [Mortierella alpina]